MRCERIFLLVTGALVLASGAPWVTGAGATPLEVRIVDADGARVDAGRYVALYATGSSGFSDPLLEALVAEDEPMPGWDPGPGTYRALCSAVGYGSLLSEPVTVAPGDVGTVATCRLQSLVTLRGRVVNEAGEAVPGAELGPLRAFLPDHPGRWSELGEAHARRAYVVRTDARGTFQLAVHPDSRVSVLVTEPGEAIALLDGMVTPSADAVLPDIVVHPAGGVEVRWTPPPDVDGAWRVRLVPASGVPREWSEGTPLLFWLRDREADRWFWRTVPAGTYRVMLDGEPLARAGLVPRRVAELSVTPGQVATVDVAPEAVRAPTEQVTGGVLWQLDASRAGGGIPPDLRLVSVNPTTQEAALHGFELGADAGAQPVVRFGGPCSADRVVTAVSAEGWVAGPVPMPEGSCSGGGKLPLRPLVPGGEVALRLRAPGEMPLPRVAAAHVSPCGGGDAGTAVGSEWVAMLIGEEPDPAGMAAQLILPAGCFDARLHVSGFVPEVVAELEVAPHRRSDGGVVQLEPAGTVIVRVVDGLAGRGVAAEVATSCGATGKAVAQNVLARLDVAAPWERCTADEDGWCRIRGLAPGRCRLVARAEGYGVTIGEEFALHVGGDQELADLVMVRPGDLRVSVDRAVLTQETVREPQVQVIPDNWCVAADSLQRSEEVGPNGEVLFRQLTSGAWTVRLVALDADGGFWIVDEGQVEVVAGDTTSVLLGGDLVPVVGELRLRDEPLAARLEFWSSRAAASATTRSREDGEFEVFLPGPGSYSVDVAATDRQLVTTVAEVEIRLDERLELELPGGRITGRVLDAEGTPVADALVEATQPRPDNRDQKYLKTTVSTAADGGFVLDGLSGGAWAVAAAAGGRRSDSQAVTMDAADAVGGVVLVLRDAESLRGRVVDEVGRSRPGVQVAVTGQPTVAGEMTFVRWFVTDASGEFTVPRVAPVANVELAPTGGPVHVAVVRLDQDFEITLGEASATLVIEEQGAAAAAGVLVLVREGGGFLSLENGLARGGWASRSGEGLVVPRLAAGRWHLGRVVRPSPDTVAKLIQGEVTALSGTRSLLLVPGATEVVGTP